MPLNNPAFRAGGTINTSRFVTIDTTAGKDFQAVQSNGATSLPIGISQDGSKRVPGVNSLTAADTEIAAEAGDAIQIYGLGDVCLLDVGTAANISAGAELTADSDGKAVAATAGQYVGAIALENASKSTSTIGNLVRVQVVHYQKANAGA